MMSGARGHHIAELVDALLAVDKSLLGNAGWAEGQRPGQRRMDWPVMVEGQTADCKVAAESYPEHDALKFSVSLVYSRHPVWRLDFEPDHTAHFNPPARAGMLGGSVVRGQHYHAWADNRYTATHGSLSKQLPCARPLPSTVQRWENAFRWFLGEVNIAQPPVVPELPKRTRLL